MRDHNGRSVAGPARSRRFRPNLQFPSQPRERIAIASYPFREFIAGKESKSAKPMDVKDFAAHVIEKFQVNKIEPWTGHFPSTIQSIWRSFVPPWKNPVQPW